MTDKSTEVKLLELFDMLSKSFYSLSANYDKLKQDLDLVSKSGQSIVDIKQITCQMDKDLQIVKQSCINIEKISFELQAYQSTIRNIPGEIFEHLHIISNDTKKILSDLSNHAKTAADLSKEVSTTFNDDFVNAIKNTKELSPLIIELKSISKLSKLISKPLAIVILFITLVLSTASALMLISRTKEQIENRISNVIEKLAENHQSQKQQPQKEEEKKIQVTPTKK